LLGSKLDIAFFLSSRRRHTRFSRDWSSDVCSSDLVLKGWIEQQKAIRIIDVREPYAFQQAHLPPSENIPLREIGRIIDNQVPLEIGRASCRERLIDQVEGAAQTRAQCLAWLAMHYI